MGMRKMAPLLYFSVLAVWFLTGPAFAGWAPIPIRSKVMRDAGLKGGEGFQMVYALEYARSDPRIVYLSTDQSRVWKSEDGGINWSPKNTGIFSHGAKSIGVDPMDPDVVYAAGFLGRWHNGIDSQDPLSSCIYKTTNGGVHWSCIKPATFFGQSTRGSLFAFDTSTYDADPRQTKTIFAGTFSDGLLRSDDSGKNWRAVGLKGTEILDIEKVYKVAGMLLIATKDGLYRTMNDRISKVGNGLPTWPRAIAVSPQSGVVYCATGKNGIYQSDDAGSTFTLIKNFAQYGSTFALIKNLAQLGSYDFNEIAVSPVEPLILYIKNQLSGIDRPPFYSHDGGTTFFQPTQAHDGNPFQDTAGYYFTGPVTPHPSNPKEAMTVSNGRGRIVRTTDGGKSWKYSGNGFTGARARTIAFSKKYPSRMVFFTTDHGIWLSDDAGSTFQHLNSPRVFGHTSSHLGAIKDDLIVASIGTWHKQALAVSQNEGKDWHIFKDYLVDGIIAFHSSVDSVIYAGNYRSDNDGTEWKKLENRIEAIHPFNGDWVYAMAVGSKGGLIVKRSKNRGESWTTITEEASVQKRACVALEISPGDTDYIIVATSNGVLIHNGSSWSMKSRHHGLSLDAFGKVMISAIAVDPNDSRVLYAGRHAPGFGESNGIFRSVDRGISWQSITENLGPAITVWSLSVSPHDAAPYLGSSMGVWKYNLVPPKNIMHK